MRVNAWGRAAILAAVFVQTANAMASDDTVSTFTDKEQHVLGIGAVLHWKNMDDAVMVFIGNRKDDKGGMILHVHDQAEWKKFVSYWEQAKATPAPDHGWVDGGTMKDANGIELTFTKYASGAIGFGLGDDDFNTRDFKLDHSLFGAFDSKIQGISATLTH